MKLVIFDVDGTLIDSQLMIVNSMNAGMAEADVLLELEEDMRHVPAGTVLNALLLG